MSLLRRSAQEPETQERGLRLRLPGQAEVEVPDRLVRAVPWDKLLLIALMIGMQYYGGGKVDPQYIFTLLSQLFGWNLPVVPQTPTVPQA